MERALASVQRVDSLYPIEGADKIEAAKIGGWYCVVKKGEFKEGDLGVFFEIDSVLPDKPQFEFMRDRKFRVKTIKLRKQISQGLFMPFSDVFPGVACSYPEGTDLTLVLGVTKYETDPYNRSSNAPRSGAKDSTLLPWPGFVPKTDETRVQHLKTFLERYEGTKVYATEKLDGSSMTCFYKNGKFGVCSRNFELYHIPERNFLLEKVVRISRRIRGLGKEQDASNTQFWVAAKAQGIPSAMKKYGKNLAIQGELIGPGIQGNKYQLDALEYHVFNAYFIDEKRYANFTELAKICETLQLRMVPVIGAFALSHTIDELVSRAEGFSRLNDKTIREGYVVRPLEEMTDPFLGRWSFKVINPYFLLAEDNAGKKAA
jgi:RNA ligase (TIGR02306 family)